VGLQNIFCFWAWYLTAPLALASVDYAEIAHLFSSALSRHIRHDVAIKAKINMFKKQLSSA